MENNPTTNFSFRGAGVAVVTPFKPSGAIDFEALSRLLEHLVAGGVDYIVALGTTGESPTLSRPEKKAFIEFTVEQIAGRIPIVVGIGGNCTSDVILAIHATPLKGVDAILSVSPYYNKPTQEGLYHHYKAIAETSPVPVILYNVPGRTGSNISALTTLRLAADFSNIIGIKEASGNMDQIFQLIMNRPEGFLVISGDDALTLPMMASGADGVISVVANAFPAEFSNMVRLCRNGNFSEARYYHYLLVNLINALFADGSPGGIKAALNVLGLCENILRLPLVPVHEQAYKNIQSFIRQIQSI